MYIRLILQPSALTSESLKDAYAAAYQQTSSQTLLNRHTAPKEISPLQKSPFAHAPICACSKYYVICPLTFQKSTFQLFSVGLLTSLFCSLYVLYGSVTRLVSGPYIPD